jgi:uncharacterized protein YggE
MDEGEVAMRKTFPMFLSCIVFAIASPAQIPSTARPGVRATGTASVFAAPDQAIVDVTVSTRAATAQAAGSQNATQTAAVLSALTQLLGSAANIKTTNYSITPIYSTPVNGGTPSLTGFNASNTVEVTLSSVNTIGSVIDTATQAGATSIGGVRFSLKDPEPSRRQALQQAATVAKSHADAMASALGGTTGTIVLLQEGSSVQPVVGVMATAPATTTPIESGLIEIDATVTLEAQLN